ncbi:unnamed protein product [Durusdinium trenchii]|uniref:Uncharacterized protein n=1 Tax=Durusdinium trenchii TaxID=1381693 RepID=A0ABP0L3Z2_9DINO
MAWLLKRLVLAALALSSLSSAAEWDDVRDCDGGCDDNDHDEETLFQMSAVLLKQGEQAPQVPQAFDEMAPRPGSPGRSRRSAPARATDRAPAPASRRTAG